MKSKIEFLIYMSVHILLQVHQNCVCQICMKWTVDRRLLTLTCKVHRMVFSVSFHDPLNQEVAYCSPPIPTQTCFSHYGNGSVYQQLSTNETVFVLRGKINNKINGNWSCLHGASKDRTSIGIHLTGETDEISLSSVNISGPKYIHKNSKMDLLCISQKIPVGLRANFILNENPYTTIIKVGDNCYSSPNISFCTKGKCKCSNEGRSYMWMYHNFYHETTITVMCNMEFASVGVIGDCVFVDTLDEKRTEQTSNSFPLIASTVHDRYRKWNSTENYDEMNTQENDTENVRYGIRWNLFLNTELLVWISTGVVGFITITVLIVLLARRFSHGGFTIGQNSTEREIYYEAQPIENQRIYDIVLPHYEEISDMHIREDAEENEGYDEIDKESTEEEQYETPHNYIEIV
ncbi:uncharacterized protein LOC127703001 [Mytilus californianus]|uniref:uncharacterized protein LOC127703001 n=1 Tax=Mytilus californianus TaxID=6549 RepID=UPI0022479271|nr:uncharacterized protein LOC127703001 [Mytilus californianus]